IEAECCAHPVLVLCLSCAALRSPKDSSSLLLTSHLISRCIANRSFAWAIPGGSFPLTYQSVAWEADLPALIVQYLRHKRTHFEPRRHRAKPRLRVSVVRVDP